jgi:hypothetical protein
VYVDDGPRLHNHGASHMRVPIARLDGPPVQPVINRAILQTSHPLDRPAYRASSASVANNCCDDVSRQRQLIAGSKSNGPKQFEDRPSRPVKHCRIRACR